MKLSAVAPGFFLILVLAACRNAPPRESGSIPAESKGSPPQTSPAAAHQISIPTYNEHVAPILFARCATCHRPIDANGRGGTSTTIRGPGSSDPGDQDDPLCIAGAPFSVLDDQLGEVTLFHDLDQSRDLFHFEPEV